MDFANLPAHERAELTVEAREALRRAKNMPLKLTDFIFGEKRSAVLRRVRREAEKQQAASAVGSLDDGERHMAVVKGYMPKAPLANLKWDLVRKAAHRAERHDRGGLSREEAEAEAAIAAWQQRTSSQLSELAAVCPNLEFLAKRAVPLPGAHSDMLVLDLRPQRAEDAMVVALALEQPGMKFRTNLKEVLAQSWETKHQLVSAQNDDEPRQEAPPTRCQVFGMCVCKGVGKKVYQLRKRLLGVMKIVFPASGTDRKAVLKASCVVIRLQHCSSGPVDGEPAWEDGLVLHIGCMYLSPFRPTFRECELLGEPAENIIRIRGTNFYKVERDIFRTMALDSVRWQVIYYVLRERKLPKMPFDPSIMECIRYTTEAVDSGYDFWPHRSPRSGRGGQLAPPAPMPRWRRTRPRWRRSMTRRTSSRLSGPPKRKTRTRKPFLSRLPWRRRRSD